MKVAIASEGRDENSMVSNIGGRAPYYLIFEDGKLVEVISNPFRIGGGGAGFSVARMLADRGVNKVIAGRMGPNMRAALLERGVKAVELSGITVKQALERA
ncbi:hypothetical protein DRN74_02700 [Candidatus Micrarchaeota archaeon]|nr:MAG: hypothetical protein DRN74_02700 [Candidatus Micrarchaeota archaeon]